MRKPGHVVLIALGLSACGDGPSDPPAAGNGVRLVIAPTALLLAEPGESQQLQAYAVDADGDSTLVGATFQSSDPSVVAVSGSLATGGAALGSAQIEATSGELTSAPILVLRAEPAAGALLVADSQVVGAIAPVDPAAPYALGWQYRVRLRGVAAEVGQIVLATGGSPVGGRVVSSAAAGGDLDVVLELISIGAMFDALSVNERLSLANVTLAVPDELRSSFDIGRTSKGGIRLARRRGGFPSATFRATPSVGTGAIEQEFELGPFDCKAEVPPAFTFPLTLDVFSMELDPSLDLDLVIASSSLQRLVVEGSLAPRITANPRLTAAVEAKAECKVEIATVILPIGGPLALIIGGQVPLGVGFEVGAKASFGELGIDAFLQSSVSAELGIDCADGCRVVADIGGSTPAGFFKPILPTLGTGARFELSGSAFGWGALTIGNQFLEALQFKTVEMKAGLEQKFELATPEVQAADPAYASSYALKPVIEAKAAANLTPLADLLQINLATLSFAPELPTLAQSARGTFSITPPSVAPGDDTQLGETATFTVNLTDATYLGAYAIEAVQIRWRRMVGETVVLESGRPGCTDLAATQDQVTFTCVTDFLMEHAGEQTFHAFVKTRIFGVPIPIPLEVANDGKAVVRVSETSAATITLGWGGSGEPVNGEVRVGAADLGPGGPVCNVTYQPIPAPLASAATTCQLAGASGGGGWTATISAVPGSPVTITANGSVSAAAAGGTGWRARASTFFFVTFTVAGGSVRYSLDGNAQVSGHEGTDWPVNATVYLNAVPSGQVVRVSAGCSLQACEPAAVPLSSSGELPPGQYVISGTLEAGSGASLQEARTGSGQYSFQLVLSP